MPSERVLLILNKPAARNPVVHMYVHALRGSYDLTIACADPAETAAVFPCVQTAPLFGDNLVMRARTLLRPVKELARRLRGGGTPPEAADAVARPGGHPSGGQAAPAAPGGARRARRVEVPFLRTHLSDSLSIAMHLRRLGRHAAIIAIDANVLVPSWLLARWWRGRYAYFQYEIWPYEYPHYSADRSYTLSLVERFGARRAYRSIVPHDRLGTVLVRRYGIPRAATVAIHTCPALPEPGDAAVHTPMRFYYHGGLMRGRGLEHLVRAMHEVDGAILTLRGIGPLEAELRQLIVDEGLAGRVVFTPPVTVDRLAQAGTEFDVGVNVTCPDAVNHRFNIGFKTFENMAAGLALASSRSHVLGHFTRQHDVGITFEGCRKDAIVAALRYCVANPERVSEWKRRSRMLAEREFNLDVQSARLRDLIADMVGRTPAVRPAPPLAAPVVADGRHAHPADR